MKIRRALSVILVVALLAPAIACSSKPTFEQQRTSVVQYLRAFNKVDTDLSDSTVAIMSSVPLNLVSNLLQVNNSLAQLLSALQGGLQRASELNTPSDETAAHLQAFKKYLQDGISAVKNLQSAIASGNQAATLKASSDFGAMNS